MTPPARSRLAGSSPRGRGKLPTAEVPALIGGLIPARAGKTSPGWAAPPPSAAHPRAGGENEAGSGFSSMTSGSSPRGRGKPLQFELVAGVGRLIPARAGKTTETVIKMVGDFGSSPRGRGKRRYGRTGQRADGLIPARAGKTFDCELSGIDSRAHPRAGGENGERDQVEHGGTGSSPRGRGKPPNVRRWAYGVRLIPARAGKTMMSMTEVVMDEAHPRAGGENALSDAPSLIECGSSPRGRGKHQPRNWRKPRGGLIPARAGKTSEAVRHTHTRRAHPRAGGENQTNRNTGGGELGSSPRGRGKLDTMSRGWTCTRLIPARAGKTSSGCGPSSNAPAHPRAGGENYPDSPMGGEERGSSPRGRGKQGAHLGYLVCARLIPARAGKTLRGHSHLRDPAAHPRAGGENQLLVAFRSHSGGSSPRGRGKPFVRCTPSRTRRLIPARAGKTIV